MERSKNHAAHKSLLNIVKHSGIDVYDSENENVINTMRRIFRTVFHYTALNWVGGEKIPLEEAPDEAIYKAFLGHYKRARKSSHPNQGLLFEIY